MQCINFPWDEKQVFREDYEFISDFPVLWDKLQNKTILVTGATGLIGSTLVKALLWKSMKAKQNMKVLAFVRDIDKAKRMFAAQLGAGAPVEFICGDITDSISVNGPVDAIIHTAGVTSSKMFIRQPVETARIILSGMNNVLTLAKEKRVQSAVFLSTMEVYGAPSTERRITEADYDYLDPMQVRSCYPEGKRMAECLCAGYAKEYGVPVKVLRLTQTFGPGVNYGDERVFAEFARCAIEQKPIVLHTKGETKRNYLYTADAATAVLTTLLNGENGQAYHAANEETFCSIYEMACLVAKKCARPPIEVNIALDDGAKFGYAPVLKMNLDTEKLRKLGWHADTGLLSMYRRMIAAMR